MMGILRNFIKQKYTSWRTIKEAYRGFRLWHRLQQRAILSQTKQIPRAQVTSILGLRERTHSDAKNFGCGVSMFECNGLPSNNPGEDRRAEGQLLLSKGLLFGVFDGHGSYHCAQAVSDRLFDYISISLLQPDLLEEIAEEMSKTGKKRRLVKRWDEDADVRFDITSEHMYEVYKKSLLSFINDTLITSSGMDILTVEESLETAFLRLDADLSSEAMNLPMGTETAETAANSVLSGTCACVAYIDGRNLVVANAGDCRAILGQRKDDSWQAVQLTRDHTIQNEKEYERILSSHPSTESSNIFQNERLLNYLQPLRAFGDVRLKWQVQEINNFNSYRKSYHQGHTNGIIDILPHYVTPPYLTAQPEITHHTITPKDRFLILSTDGLFEHLTPEEVVSVVGEHLSGRHALFDFQLPRDPMNPNGFVPLTLQQICDSLRERKRTRQLQLELDRIAATHVIRSALGRSEKGDLDEARVSRMLALPATLSRQFRDDITITVIHFYHEGIVSNLPGFPLHTNNDLKHYNF